MRSTVLIRS